MAWHNAYLTGGPSGKVCAFCKHWYDPSSAAIRPKQVKAGLWEYDHDKENICMACKFKRHAWQRCSKFESKL